MRAWICLLTAGALLAMSQTGLGQRAGRSPAGGGGQDREDSGARGSGMGGSGMGGSGMGGSAAGGFGVGGAADDNLSDPDSVFGIDRGNNIGTTAENVQSFSAIDGGASATGMGGAARGGAFGGGFGGLGGLGGLFGGAGGLGGVPQQEPATRIRTRLRADSRLPNAPAPQVESRIESRWAKLPSEPRFRDVKIEMRGRTAILNGEVGNGEDRRMAELLLRLEPGVSKIENQLLVASDGPDEISAPPMQIPPPPANEAAGE